MRMSTPSMHIMQMIMLILFSYAYEKKAYHYKHYYAYYYAWCYDNMPCTPTITHIFMPRITHIMIIKCILRILPYNNNHNATKNNDAQTNKSRQQITY